MMKILATILLIATAAVTYSDPDLLWGSDQGFSGSDQVLYTNGVPVEQGSDWLVELVNIANGSVLHSTTNGFWAGDGYFYVDSAPDAVAWNGLSIKTIIYNAPTRLEADLFAEFSSTNNLSWSTSPSPPATINYNAGSVGAGGWDGISSLLRYAYWLESYNITNTNVALDFDDDELGNLAEYAHGGDPTNSADGVTYSPSFSSVVDGGFTGFEYVYTRRRDYEDRGLIYRLELTDDLTVGDWGTNGYSVSGTAVINTDFEAVTNRLSTAIETNRFIRLQLDLAE